MGNILWSILWTIGLLIVGWPLGGLFAGFYILCLPFAACIEPCKDLVEFIKKVMELPKYFADQIVAQKEMC